MNLLVRRCAAYVVDVVILFAVIAPASFAVRKLIGFEPTTGFEVWIAAFASFSLPVWIYFVLCDASESGATLGKRLLGIRVLDADPSSRVGRGKALARTAVKLVPWELAHTFGFALVDVVGGPAQSAGLIGANAGALVYFLVCAFDRGRRSVHDYVAGTRVGAASDDLGGLT